MASAADVPTLSDAASWATPAELKLIATLLAAGQGHVFAAWRVGADEARKHAFFETVAALEANYPGGIAAYVANAKELLRASAAGENPFAGMKPEVRARAAAGACAARPLFLRPLARRAPA